MIDRSAKNRNCVGCECITNGHGTVQIDRNRFDEDEYTTK